MAGNLEARPVFRVKFAARELRDWDSFYDACSAKFRFPPSSGRNKDAWLERMEELDRHHQADGSAAFPSNALVLIEFEGRYLNKSASREIVDFLLSGAAWVNGSRLENRETPQLQCVERLSHA